MISSARLSDEPVHCNQSNSYHNDGCTMTTLYRVDVRLSHSPPKFSQSKRPFLLYMASISASIRCKTITPVVSLMEIYKHFWMVYYIQHMCPMVVAIG